ncbi:MAG: peptidase M3, partial [Tissierellia bacterium]|nr:peptidase M3 [Tissierellia bacterium]
MVKFKDYKYERPDLDKITDEFNTLLDKFSGAKTYQEQNRILK